MCVLGESLFLGNPPFFLGGGKEINVVSDSALWFPSLTCLDCSSTSTCYISQRCALRGSPFFGEEIGGSDPAPFLWSPFFDMIEEQLHFQLIHFYLWSVLWGGGILFLEGGAEGEPPLFGGKETGCLILPSGLLPFHFQLLHFYMWGISFLGVLGKPPFGGI